MRIHHKAIAADVVLLLMTGSFLLAWGNPPPGRWEKVAETKPGEWITIHTRDGAEHKYRFMSLDERLLTCRDAFNEEVKLDLASVRRIIREDSGKYGKQGALVGALGGAAGGLALVGIGTSLDNGGVVLFTGITAALGAAAGYIIGTAADESEETIYIAPDTAQAEVK